VWQFEREESVGCPETERHHNSTFFQEDAFQQRVFVTQHEAFIGGMAMSSLEVG
jgi:hypothetical protein